MNPNATTVAYKEKPYPRVADMDLEQKKAFLPEYYKRANETIGLIPGPGQSINLIQRLLYAYLLKEACRQGDKQEYQVLLVDICRELGITKDNQAYVWKNLQSVSSLRYIENTVREYEDGNPSQKKKLIQYLNEPSIETRSGHPTIIGFSLSNAIKAKILNPDEYTSLPLHSIAALKNGHAVALAEICFRYFTNRAGKGYGTTGAKSPEWWYPRILGHLPRKGYGFKYFRREVLDKAQNIINSSNYLPFTIKYIDDKNGGKSVKTLEIHIYPKAAQITTNQEGGMTSIGVPQECIYLITKIKEVVGGSRADAIAIIKLSPEHLKIEEHLRLYQEQVASGWRPLSPIASFKTRVKDDWGSGKSAIQYSNKAATHQSQEPITSILPDPKLEKYMADVALATQRFNDLSKDDQQLAIDRFLGETSDYIRKAYKSDGMASQSIRGSFNAWLVESNYFG